MRDFDQQLLRMKAVLGMTSDQAVAAALGMTKAAFSDRKKRGAFPEDKLRVLAQQRPELLLDVDYVLTGQRLYQETAERHATMMAAARRQLELTERGSNAESISHLPGSELPPDEQLLLEAYRDMTATARKELLAQLLTGGKKPKPKAPSGAAGIKVSGSGHRVAGRDFNERKE
ncbi:helix-turn-helix domain-containing protein [Pseudomonas aeruginosa]|uniref:helix-turn-helix domain-containing protein n=1 Tax=Pseudomonas aeruginosa TaxID=287 RepID=UPI002412579A|nr:helix-turn-helix domain containing protein [Pseudomonas aeruginosa]MDG4071311.1 helix-turn-helix domain containing protein [Pseudomonas aeruginosa]